MTPPRPFALICAGLLLGALHPAVHASPAPWRQPLYLSGGGYWPERAPIHIVNPSKVAAAGEPVEVSIPSLAGASIQSLRVCNEGGQELLWNVLDAAGSPKLNGRLLPSDRLALPVECAAQSATTEYVYAGNEQALAVPDFFQPGLVNGQFESGTGSPAGWNPGETDAQHVVTWETTGGHGGGRCLSTRVDAGAPATWVRWSQDSIPVVPGRSYRLRAWVRGQNVSGGAGWYLHVNGDKPLLLNESLSGGDGSYDWKPVSLTFTAPVGAVAAEVGTFLHGAGRAWYDDVELSAAGGGPSLQATPGPLEHLTALVPRRVILSRPGWPYRAVLRVYNLTTPGDTHAANTHALAYVDLRSLHTRLRGVAANAVLQVIDPDSGQPVSPCLRYGDGVVFAASVPAGTVKEYDLFYSGTDHEPANAFKQQYARLVDNSLNLAPNGSFEQGGDMPEGWTPSGEAGSRKFTADRAQDSLFGRYSLRTSIPPDAPKDWVGWRTGEIPVTPGSTLLYGGFLKSKGLTGPSGLYAHLHAAPGKMASTSPYVGTDPQVTGDSGWTFTSSLVQTPPDATSIQLHLTTNQQGTILYDGIFLCQALPGEVVRLESGRNEAPGTGLRVWETNPLVKVFPDDVPGAPLQLIQAQVARSESHAIQIALRSDVARSGVQVSVSALQLTSATAGRQPSTLPPVKIDRVGYVPVDHPSGYFSSDVPSYYRRVPNGPGSTDGWAGEWPDPLMPNSPFNLTAHRVQPIWLTVRAPANAMPGLYVAHVTIRVPGQPAVTIPLRVTMLPFSLPDRTHLKVIFDLRSGPGHDLFAGKDRLTELRKWYRLMADHRMATNLIDPPPVFSYAGGKVSMDATRFDLMAHYVLDELGLNGSYTPDFFYSFGWAYPPSKIFGLEPFTPEYNRALQDAIRLFSKHLKEKGWYDRFTYYISDEPHFDQPEIIPQMQKLCALVHEADPGFRIYSSTWRYCPAWDNSLDIWGVGQYGSFPLADMKRLQKAGKQFWFTEDGQIVIDTPYLATERLLPYYCFKYGLTGYEYWGLSWWTYNPWERGWHTFIRQSDEGKKYYWTRYPDGDGYLTYPGAPVGVDGPVSSIRLEQVREGLQDYEALRLLSERVESARKAGRSVQQAEKALEMARSLVVIPNAGGNRSSEILPDPDRVPAVRRAVNDALVELQ